MKDRISIQAWLLFLKSEDHRTGCYFKKELMLIASRFVSISLCDVTPYAVNNHDTVL